MNEAGPAGPLELVHQAYNAWNWFGTERFGDFLSEDVVLEDAPEMPDARVTRGSGDAVARLDEVAASVGGGWVEIRAMEKVAGSVLVGMTWNLDDGGASGARVGEVWHLIDVADERITRIRVFLDRESATRI